MKVTFEFSQQSPHRLLLMCFFTVILRTGRFFKVISIIPGLISKFNPPTKTSDQFITTLRRNYRINTWENSQFNIRQSYRYNMILFWIYIIRLLHWNDHDSPFTFTLFQCSLSTNASKILFYCLFFSKFVLCHIYFWMVDTK